MLSLKKLFGKDDKFFDLLEAGAEEAKTSVELFSRYLQTLAAGGTPAGTLDDFIQTRRKEKHCRHKLSAELSKTSVTPFERDDIEALSWALYRFQKQVEKIVERMSIYPGRVPHTAFRNQTEIMLQAADTVLIMVRQLRVGTTISKIHESNDRLQAVENEAERVMFILLKDVYHGPYDAKELVILQALYEMIEQSVRCCRDAGNIVIRIVLKLS